MMRSWHAALALALLIGGASPGAAHAQRRERDKITRAEVEASSHRDLDLYQVIRSLRPHFLEVRGVRSVGNSSASGTPILLYVDGKRDAGIDALRNIPARNVEEVRYLSPTAAATEFGPSGANGAVIVKLKRRPRPSEGAPPAPLRR